MMLTILLCTPLTRAVGAQEPQRSLDFYTRVLGMTCDFRNPTPSSTQSSHIAMSHKCLPRELSLPKVHLLCMPQYCGGCTRHRAVVRGGAQAEPWTQSLNLLPYAMKASDEISTESAG